MPKAGTYTALQKLKPIEADFGAIATKAAEASLARRKQLQSEKKDRQVQRDKIGFDNLEPVITGIDTLDQGIALGIGEATDMQHADFKKALNDPSFADSADYKIRTKNLNDYSKNVKKFSDGFSELAQTVIAKSNEGTLSAWDDELLSTLNGGFVSEKAKFGVNEMGGVEAYIASTDQLEITEENPEGYILDEDGKMKLTKVTPNEIFKGLGQFSVTGDVDIQQTSSDIGTKLGKSITSEIDGFTITSEQSWETKKGETRKIVRGMLGSPHAPTSLAKRLWADVMGKDSRKLTEGNMTSIEDKLLESIKPYYDEEVKKTKNFASRDKALKRAEDKNKDKIKAEYVVNPETGVATTTKIDGVDANIVSFGDGKGIEVVGNEASKESIQNIYVDANGDIFADKIVEIKVKGDPPINPETGKPDMVAWALQGKGWKSENKPKVKMTNTDFTNLAKNPSMVDENGNNFKDGKALKDYLKRRKELLPKGKKLKGKEIKAESGNTYN